MLYPVPYINSIVFLKKIVYEYRLGLPEQSMNPEQMKKKLPMHTKVIERLSKYYCSKKVLGKIYNVSSVENSKEENAYFTEIQTFRIHDY